MNRTQLFEDWKRRADEGDLLATAIAYGAALKRNGQEHCGPCPYCGGTDRFSVNPAKRAWNCRGHGGGRGAIALVMHIAGLSFTQTCEALTGEPNPSGVTAKPLTANEMRAREQKRAEADAKQREVEAAAAAAQENTRDAAARIWAASRPIDHTLAQTYLISRGLPEFRSNVMRFNASLPYPNGKRHPALVARVDDADGNLCAVWRIFLREDGRKADVDNAKLGLGPAGGGAVRIGGVARKIAVAEGVETALAVWHLLGKSTPVWAALSTSGMVGLEELPLEVEHVVIYPDGDRPMRKRGHEFEAAIPAGRKAAESLRAKLLSAGVACTIAPEPAPGRDYLNIWNSHCREVA